MGSFKKTSKFFTSTKGKMNCNSKIINLLQSGKMLLRRTPPFQIQIQAFCSAGHSSENQIQITGNQSKKLYIVESFDKCRSFKEVDINNPNYEEYSKLCQRVNEETGLLSVFFHHKEKHIGYRVHRESISYCDYPQGLYPKKK